MRYLRQLARSSRFLDLEVQTTPSRKKTPRDECTSSSPMTIMKTDGVCLVWIVELITVAWIRMYRRKCVVEFFVYFLNLSLALFLSLSIFTWPKEQSIKQIAFPPHVAIIFSAKQRIQWVSHSQKRRERNALTDHMKKVQKHRPTLR